MSEPDVSSLLSVPQALQVLDTFPVRPLVTQVRIEEALGHVLAADVFADRDYPPFDKSQMDGYALHSSAASGPPFTLPVSGEILPGATAAPLAAGHAAAIMTGAPMPAGADSVIPVEDTRRERQGGPVTFLVRPTPGRFIAARGSDVGAGALLIKKGTMLRPADLAVAATVGATPVPVYAKPAAAVLSTGDELVPVDATPGPAQIRNTNGLTIAALLRRLGVCSSVSAPERAVADEPAAVRAAIVAAMDAAEVLFVSGGMSMGTHDFVPRTLLDLGFTLHITKLRIKPGKPFVFATKERADGRPVIAFGLPGNPVSSFVCTLRLAVRLLKRMAGADPNPRPVRATLGNPLPANGPREFYHPVRVENGVATPLNWKGSADVFTLAQADALLVRPENEPALAAGAAVELLEIP